MYNSCGYGVKAYVSGTGVEKGHTVEFVSATWNTLAGVVAPIAIPVELPVILFCSVLEAVAPNRIPLLAVMTPTESTFVTSWYVNVPPIEILPVNVVIPFTCKSSISILRDFLISVNLLRAISK